MLAQGVPCHIPNNGFGSLPRLPPPNLLFVLLLYRSLGSQELVSPKLGKAVLGMRTEAN